MDSDDIKYMAKKVLRLIFAGKKAKIILIIVLILLLILFMLLLMEDRDLIHRFWQLIHISHSAWDFLENPQLEVLFWQSLS